MKRFIVILALVLFISPQSSLAHGGRTAADGCHNDRKAGMRHCHGAKPKSKPAPALNYVAPKKLKSGNVYYKNCTAARAAGVTPIRRGQPGYASHLVLDKDGIACE